MNFLIRALKHSCVTHVAKLLNGNLIGIQDHVGHVDPRSTMKYLRVTQRDARGNLLSGDHLPPSTAAGGGRELSICQ